MGAEGEAGMVVVKSTWGRGGEIRLRLGLGEKR
jgi:hypothetical protein